ncbi:MAG: hypothetical protein V1740_04320 [Candidatus Woesearchaeota archaeon]
MELRFKPVTPRELRNRIQRFRAMQYQDVPSDLPFLPMMALDTYGTLVDIDARLLNESLFDFLAEKGDDINVSPAELEKFKQTYAENPKDPDYILRTDPLKAQMVRDGYFQAEFFPDALDFFARALEHGYALSTATKGGPELFSAFYDQKLPEELRFYGRTFHTYRDFIDLMVSSSQQTVRDKTDPACYDELARTARDMGYQVLSYTSDDAKEADAADRCHENILGIHIPVDGHQCQAGQVSRVGNLVTTDSLVEAVELTDLRYHSLVWEVNNIEEF